LIQVNAPAARIGLNNKMLASLAAKYDQSLPRYTSYPTAPQFNAGVDAGRYGDWLGALTPGSPVSLYIHVPFCGQLCWYCGCHTSVARRYGPIGAYVELLEREIDLVAAAAPQGLVATHVHWGGGTPNMLSGRDFGRVMDRLRAAFDFAPNCQVEVELDPRQFNAAQADDLARSGVTRANLGVQEFDPAVQSAVNRVQPVTMIGHTVAWLRQSGIDDVGFDMLYGLPFQTEMSIMRSAEIAAEFDPRRIAWFGYAHVPWMKPHQALIDEAALPGAEARLAMAEAAAGRLLAHGYRRIGLDHFALPDDDLALARQHGTLRRNFQGYTADAATTLIGLGASSIGMLAQGYVQNAPSVPAYRAALAAGKLATRRGVTLTDEDRLRRDVIESLMCYLQVDAAAFAARYDLPDDYFAPEMERLAPLADDGLVTLGDSIVLVTPAGRPFLRHVCAAFDRYLDAPAARFSRAV
jgi:oxygen-independent coproporphyrinogen III oxidase